MGEVYKARDTKLGRMVALKILPEAFAHDAERLQRFEREARALAALNHPNIAQVFGFEQSAGVRAIAMELVEGPSLDSVHALSMPEVLAIGRQIAAALEAAHDHGIIHRDLKPANVKVRDDGTVKVLDFGLAKALDPAASGATAGDLSSSPTITSPATGIGTILGTAAYMSPEQARGRPVDRRADIWAFGVVLFELITRHRVFDGETVSDTLAAVLRQEIPWERLPADTPPQFRRLLERCLERDPHQRLRDAGDARLEIEELLGRRPEPVSAIKHDKPSTGRGRVLERAAWVLLALAAAGGGWWLARPAAEPKEAAWANFTQLTDEAGAEDMPAISPAGDAIAYARMTDGSWSIYIRRIGGRTATVVAADPDRHESAPAFSPDGRSIAFHEADADGGIFIVGATGESVRRVTQSGFHPAWSPDGRTIAFCGERIFNPASRTAVSALSVVEIATGAVREVFRGDAVQPDWSPSGRRLTFWGQRSGQRDIFSIAVEGGEPVPVTDDDALDWSPAWSPDGRFVYFASDRGGVMNLWRVAVDEASGRAGGAPEPVINGTQAGAERPTFSRDGTKLAFRSTRLSVSPAVFPIDPGTERLGEPRYVFERTGIIAPASVSPDGRWLALGSVGSSKEDIFVSRIDGTDLRRLTDDAFRDRLPVWAPDGSRLVFYSNRSGQYQLWSIRPDGSGLAQLTNRAKTGIWYPFFEPGTSMLWGYDFTRQAQIKVDLTQPTPTAGVDVPGIAIEGGVFRAHGFSRDAARLVGHAISPEGTRFGVGWHDLRSGATRIFKTALPPSPPVWWPDGRHILYIESEHAFGLIDADTGRRRTLTGRWPFTLQLGVLALAPDGRSLFIGATTAESDIWMVERIDK